MEHQTQLSELGRVLRDARVSKGWSQRDLSAQSGVTQANISKIETGRVDLQVSSLLELARFLDLEVTLAPRQATPAIEAIVRDTQAARTPPRVARDLERLSDASSALSKSVEGPLREAGPALREATERLNDQVTSAQLVGNSFATPFAARELARIADQVTMARKLLSSPSVQAQLDFVRNNGKAIEAAAKRAAEAARSLQALRNAAVHRAPDEMRPAHSLDDEDEN